MAIDPYSDRSFAVYCTYSIVHTIASDDTLRSSIGPQQVPCNIICLRIKSGENEDRETTICKYTNDIEIDHIHRENDSSFLNFKGAKGFLLSHVEELRKRRSTNHYIDGFL